MNPYILLGGLGLAGACLVMALLWIVYLRTGNPAVVDPGWAGVLAALGGLYAFAGRGHVSHRILIGVMAGVWGTRLCVHLVSRAAGGRPDGRYDTLRQEWKTGLRWKFFLFFEAQAVLACLLSIVFLLTAMNPAPGLSGFEIGALALSLAALAGEAVADAQLEAFKRHDGGRGDVCRRGLWNYSRHPNYFFEWLVWVAFALAALAAPCGWIGVCAPAVMLYLLFRVTGIPATEAQAVRTRGEAYREYQRTTSAFVPWFRRRSAAVPPSGGMQ